MLSRLAFDSEIRISPSTNTGEFRNRHTSQAHRFTRCVAGQNGAHGPTRTDTGRLLEPLPLPLGYMRLANQVGLEPTKTCVNGLRGRSLCRSGHWSLEDVVGLEPTVLRFKRNQD